ncbi:MAG: threonine synthase [Spirochaetaceae bacterium]
MKFSYICSECGKEYEITPDIMLCKKCSLLQKNTEPLRGILEVKLTGIIEGGLDIHELLPVEKKYFPAIPVGNTPLWEPERIRKKTGFNGLFIKDDSLNPTGSLKDRASYLVAAFAIKHKISKIVLASTGNAGSSMSGVGAAAGLKIKLFLPKSAPQAKIIQALQYGAEVVKVDGNYDMAFDLSLEYSKKEGGLNRNTAFNPMTIEGKKTVALEIFKQLQKAPDYLFVPVGDGVIISGIYKGFADLKQLGFIEKVPTVYGVQAEGSSAIYTALKTGNFDNPISSSTIADSISVDIPRGGYYALKMLKKYNGKVITVSDEQILNAQKEMASLGGLFAEPAAASSYAGFLKERNSLPVTGTIVLLITGNGLKDISAATKGLQQNILEEK